MLQKFTALSPQKFAVYFLYICAQILVLASLLLTSTSIIPHIIFMMLAIVFYFLTALKDPGIFMGTIEPNMEDLQHSKNNIQKDKKIEIHKKYGSQRDCANGKFDDLQWKKNIKQNNNHSPIKDNQEEPKEQLTQKRKTSLQYFNGGEQIKIEINGVQMETQKPEKNSSLNEKKNNFFSAAKDMFGNLTGFLSKKKIQFSQDQNSTISKKQQNLSKPQTDCIKHQSQGKKSNYQLEIRSVCKERRANSAIEQEDFTPQQINQQFLATKRKNLIDTERNNKSHIEMPTTQRTAPKTIADKLAEIKRYCRICESYQPLRVKHCHSCDKCISTFDHHCPWMANCIGQKNKLLFIAYLFIQTLQIFTIIVDLIKYISIDQPQNSSSVGILLMAMLLFFIMMLVLLAFHIYLISNNITTWQLLRWKKIEYLTIFDKQKIGSPFDKGIIENFFKLWEYSRSPELNKWSSDVRQDLTKLVVRKPRQSKTQCQPLDSDRKPFRSQKAI